MTADQTSTVSWLRDLIAIDTTSVNSNLPLVERVADYLRGRADVKVVNYPGFAEHPDHRLHRHQGGGGSGVMSFETHDESLGRRVVDATRLFSIAVSFGGVGSVISLPCKISHAAIPAEVRKAVEALAAQPVGDLDANAVRRTLAENGGGSFFPELTAQEIAQVRRDGKIPQLEPWRAGVRDGRLAWDTMLTLAGLESFATDQADLDARIRSGMSGRSRAEVESITRGESGSIGSRMGAEPVATMRCSNATLCVPPASRRTSRLRSPVSVPVPRR